MNLYRKLTRTVTHVQPLDARLFGDVYITVTLPVWRSFFDDWRRYGLGVAWYNLRYLLTNI